VWYDQDVFEHQEVFLASAGAGFMNKHLKRYDLLSGLDGWATYYPAQTIVRCGMRLDDDRLVGDARQYKLVINMNVVIDPYRIIGFRPFSNVFWEGTTTGQIGYNLPSGITTVVSKEYEAPLAGSFHPEVFSSHTHPSAKSLKLIAKRLGGQDFATPQRLFTLQHPIWIVEAGSQSQELNVKPAWYVRPPTLEWSEIGLKWLTGSLSTSGFDSNTPCAFQKGDIFYLESTHDAKNFMDKANDMMTLGALVLWSEAPQATVARGVDRFLMSGFLRNQLFDQFLAPHDLLAKVPTKVNQSVMFELHSRMPSLFCHPDRAADVKYVSCLRALNSQVLKSAFSVNDIDQTKLAIRQKPCGQ